MVITCPNCESKFRLDESKLQGRGAKLRCKKCNHSFEVDGKGDVVGQMPMLDDLEFDLDPGELEAAAASVNPESQLDGPALSLADSNDEDASEPDSAGQDLSLDLGGGQFSSEPQPESKPHVVSGEASIDSSPTDAPVFDDAASGLSLSADGAEDSPSLDADPFAAFQAPADSGLTHAIETSDPSSVQGEIGDPFEAPTQMLEGGMGPDGSFEMPEEAFPNEPEEPPDSIHQRETTVELMYSKEQEASANKERKPVEASPIFGLDPKSSAGRAISVAVTAVSVLVLAVGVLSYLTKGKVFEKPPDPMAGELTVGQTLDGKFAGLRATTAQASLYSPRPGKTFLVIGGEVENVSDKEYRGLDIEALITDDDGRTLARMRAPLGVLISPADISEVDSQASLDAMFARAIAGDGRSPFLLPGERLAFRVVIPEPPLHLEDYVRRILVRQGTPIEVPKQKLEPQPGDDDFEDENPKKRKRRKKRPGKRRRRRRLDRDA